MKIFLFGNPLLTIDCLPLKMKKDLSRVFPDVLLIMADPQDEIDFPKDDHFFIIDTVFGIEKVTLFDALDDFIIKAPFSVHDYDLGLHLSILQKIDNIGPFFIIGIPKNYSLKKALEETIDIIKANLPSEND